MKIINYLEINNGNIIYQSTQRKTYSLKCIYFKKTTTMNGYSECHDPRETYKWQKTINAQKQATPVAMSTPNSDILISKYHFPIKKTKAS